ncbi:MAG: dihydropteroate synthase [Ignavibacteria bacterium]|nr:dihydropteroate synthase [Ignavibacteria bacterium]MBI3766213.1 dihydropteroate synthase [Ignavibacteriales bacterium]
MQTVTSTYTFGAKQYDLTARTHIMGILNVTPDSFFDGGQFFSVEQAVARGREMVDEGADFIDIGGESTRPGSEPPPLDEELRRVLPVIERLAKATDIPLSIDTYKASVAEQALEAGAVVVNDISGLHFDDHLADVTAKHKASIVLMHIQGTPKTMQENPHYENLVEEICHYLEEGVRIAERKGIEQIVVDPGIGFGKTLYHNLELIRRLREFQRLGYPVLVGPSRKAFIGKVLDLPVDQRIEGTAAAVAVSIMNGANIVRVHDVKQMKRVAHVVDAIVRA